MKRTSSLVTALFGMGLAIAAHPLAALATGTTAGTTISNTATATYSDGTNTYNSQSNTVTTTVQNAPALTITPTQATPGANTVSPGGSMTDTYTLTNTGNSSGYFQLTGTLGTNDGVTAGQASFTQFVVNAGSGNQTFSTIAAVNTYLATGNSGGPFLSAVSGTITVGVQYTANSGASGTITTLLTPDIVYPAGSGTSLQTSTTVIGQYSDPVAVDARIDAQKTAVVGGTVAAPTVTYTVRFANGGSRDLQAVFKNALPGGNAATYDGSCTNSTACGVVFTDKIPSFNSTQLTLSGTPSISGATGTVIYSVDGTTWTTTATGAVYVGVFLPATSITGAGLTTFAPNANTTSQGNVPSANAALTLTYTINGSTATGAANATAITNVVNSIFADQSGYIEGPGITYQSVTNGTTATTTNIAPAISNTTGTLAGSAAATSAASPTNAALLNGTYDVGAGTAYPGATGPDGTTATDFTALSYTNGNALLSAVNGANVTVPASAAAATFTNSLQNNGNKDDTFTLTAATGTGLTALPTGWTVTYQSTGQVAAGNCAAVTAGTTITSVCVPSGATQTYKVVFTPPASATTFTSFTGYGDAITATSANNNTITNVTTDEIFVGGFVKLTKTVADAAGQPCATASTFTTGAANVSPGDCVKYVVSYANVAPGQGSGANNQTLSASSLVITEDGTAAGGTQVAYTNNWATYTNGLYSAPVDTNSGAFVYSPTPGTAAASTKFTDTVASLAAGTSGSVTFLCQVK